MPDNSTTWPCEECGRPFLPVGPCDLTCTTCRLTIGEHDPKTCDGSVWCSTCRADKGTKAIARRTAARKGANRHAR